MNKLFLLLLLFIAERNYPQDIVRNYILEGLNSNLALKQYDIDYQKSIAALSEARGLYMPQLEINARYSRAGGGRQIFFPAGDMLNPVYASLNYLLKAQLFPTDIKNEIIPFLRKEEQETKLRFIQPLFNPAIYYNFQIQTKISEVQQHSRNIYKQQLIADIKTAYYNYLKASTVLDILKRMKDLVEENLRVNRKLFETDKVTEDVVIRAEAEISDYEQKLEDARKSEGMSRLYFNFLLNKPLDSEILKEEQTDTVKLLSLDEFISAGLNNRRELELLNSSIKAAEYTTSLNNSKLLPSINLVLDYGIEGERYKFSTDDDYWMGSLLFQWNLFNGFQDQAKKEQAFLEQNKYELQLLEFRNKISLEIQNAWNSVQVAQKSIKTAGQRSVSSEKYFTLIKKKYELGMVRQIEFIEAQNNYMNSEINLAITRYDYQIKVAELLKAAGIDETFNKDEKYEK